VGFGHRPSGSIANEVEAVNYILHAVDDISKQAAPTIKFDVDIQHPSVRLYVKFPSFTCLFKF